MSAYSFKQKNDYSFSLPKNLENIFALADNIIKAVPGKCNSNLEVGENCYLMPFFYGCMWTKTSALAEPPAALPVGSY
ncbi:hypothetical protein ACTJIJ_05405 [Niabella sp. 22666]|uniref:hypothetical protein n=1 Tax=Niabella sp. 22666 TaxID=3453954 RepID=UPI003F84A148